MVAIPMSPKEVRAVVEGNRYDIAIIDCRSFGFGQNHKVPGAHIISCNSLVKRRSGGHTIPVGNIITADESREKLLNGEIKTVVVYDKDTQDLRSVPNDSDIKLVMRSLAEYKDISGPPRRLSDSFFFLEGGFDRYQEEYPGCVEQVSKAGPSSLQLNLKAPPAATHSSKSQMSGPVAVLPHLYLSDAEHASQAAVLEKLQIRFVVNVSKKAANHFPDRCTYFHIAVEDQADTDLGQYFEDTYKFIGRSDEWWRNMWEGKMLEKEWKRNFRMNRETFMKLVEELRPYLEKNNKRRAPYSVEKQVALTLSYLSDEGRLTKTGNPFGAPKCTMSVYVRRVCHAITNLMPRYIFLPKTEEEVTRVADGFFKKYQVPQCIGAVDGTHIPIRKPLINSTDYLNRKGYYSLNVQAMCDSNYVFTDVVVRWPGSVHDAKVYANSDLALFLQGDTIPPCPREIVRDEDPVATYIIGDPAYALLERVMIEYPGGGADGHQQYFGLKMCSARNVIECSFGRMKARFRCLNRPMDINLDELPAVIMSCFLLHNFCELNSDTANEEDVSSVLQYEQRHQPKTRASRQNPSDAGSHARCILATYLDP